MAQYLEMRDVGLLPKGSSKAWMYLGLAGQMAISVIIYNISPQTSANVARPDRTTYVTPKRRIGLL